MNFDGVKLGFQKCKDNPAMNELAESTTELSPVTEFSHNSNQHFLNSSGITAIQLLKHTFCTVISYI
jgi:hypothetical protein